MLRGAPGLRGSHASRAAAPPCYTRQHAVCGRRRHITTCSYNPFKLAAVQRRSSRSKKVAVKDVGKITSVGKEYWGRLLYQYYNWRQDTSSDLQLVLLAFVGLILGNSLLRQYLVHEGAPKSAAEYWEDMYEVIILSFGQEFPDVETAGIVRQMFSVGVAAIGLCFLALVLALVEQVVLEMIEKNVRQGSRVYESGHVLVLGWCYSQRDLEVVWKCLEQLCYAHRNEGGVTVVVLTQRQKLEMESLFRRAIPESQRFGTRFVFRQGNALIVEDLDMVAAQDAHAIMVVSDQSRCPDEADAQSLRCAILLDELTFQHANMRCSKQAAAAKAKVDLQTASMPQFQWPIHGMDKQQSVSVLTPPVPLVSVGATPGTSMVGPGVHPIGSFESLADPPMPPAEDIKASKADANATFPQAAADAKMAAFDAASVFDPRAWNAWRVTAVRKPSPPRSAESKSGSQLEESGGIALNAMIESILARAPDDTMDSVDPLSSMIIESDDEFEPGPELLLALPPSMRLPAEGELSPFAMPVHDVLPSSTINSQDPSLHVLPSRPSSQINRESFMQRPYSSLLALLAAMPANSLRITVKGLPAIAALQSSASLMSQSASPILTAIDGSMDALTGSVWGEGLDYEGAAFPGPTNRENPALAWRAEEIGYGQVGAAWLDDAADEQQPGQAADATASTAQLEQPGQPQQPATAATNAVEATINDAVKDGNGAGPKLEEASSGGLRSEAASGAGQEVATTSKDGPASAAVRSALNSIVPLAARASSSTGSGDSNSSTGSNGSNGAVQVTGQASASQGSAASQHSREPSPSNGNGRAAASDHARTVAQHSQGSDGNINGSISNGNGSNGNGASSSYSTTSTYSTYSTTSTTRANGGDRSPSPVASRSPSLATVDPAVAATLPGQVTASSPPPQSLNSLPLSERHLSGHVIVEMKTSNAVPLLKFSCSSRFMAVPTAHLNARRLAKMIREPIVASVTQQLMDFKNATNMFVQPVAELVGRRFGELAFWFDDAIVLGVYKSSKDRVYLVPSPMYVITSQDQLVLLRPTTTTMEEYKPRESRVIVPASTGNWSPTKAKPSEAGSPPPEPIASSTPAGLASWPQPQVNRLRSVHNNPGQAPVVVDDSSFDDSTDDQSPEQAAQMDREARAAAHAALMGDASMMQAESMPVLSALSHAAPLMTSDSYDDGSSSVDEPPRQGSPGNDPQAKPPPPTTADLTASWVSKVALRALTARPGSSPSDGSLSRGSRDGYPVPSVMDSVNFSRQSINGSGSSGSSGASTDVIVDAWIKSVRSQAKQEGKDATSMLQVRPWFDGIVSVSQSRERTSSSRGSGSSLGSYESSPQTSPIFMVPMEWLVVDDRPRRVLVCGWGEQSFMRALLRELDQGQASLPPGSEVVFANMHDTAASLGKALQTVRVRNVSVTHVTADPMQRSELAQLNMEKFSAAIVLCDEKWIDPDEDTTNGVDMLGQADMLRLDSMVMMVQLNVRKVLEDGERPSINIICQKVAMEGMTRFEDRKRLPLGISVNFTSFAAKLLTQASYTPMFLPAFSQYGASGDFKVVDAATLAAPGEKLSYWQLVARAQATRQILLGWYLLPERVEQPMEVVLNPQGHATRNKRRIWNKGNNTLKFVMMGRKTNFDGSVPSNDLDEDEDIYEDAMTNTLSELDNRQATWVQLCVAAASQSTNPATSSRGSPNPSRRSPGLGRSRDADSDSEPGSESTQELPEDFKAPAPVYSSGRDR